MNTSKRSKFAIIFLSILLFSCTLSLAQQGQMPAATLRVGDQAPALSSVIWLKNGPASKFGDGKVHVLEFWATWCGPCKQNMPHLAKLYQKHKDKIHVTSISIWEHHMEKTLRTLDMSAKARAFAEGANEMMPYVVGTDKEDGTANSWMLSLGINVGIPYTFVIDGEGKIAWHGNPFKGLDQVVELVMNGKYHHSTDAQRIENEYKTNHDLQRKLIAKADSLNKLSQFAKAVFLYEEAIRVMPAFEEDAIAKKYHALDQIDRKRSRAFAKELMKTHANAPILLIDRLASSIVSDPKGDYQTALELTNAGMRCAPNVDGTAWWGIAKIYAKIGNYTKAVEVQEQVVKAMEDPRSMIPASMADQARTDLKEFRSRLAAS